MLADGNKYLASSGSSHNSAGSSGEIQETVLPGEITGNLSMRQTPSGSSMMPLVDSAHLAPQDISFRQRLRSLVPPCFHLTRLAIGARSVSNSFQRLTKNIGGGVTYIYNTVTTSPETFFWREARKTLEFYYSAAGWAGVVFSWWLSSNLFGDDVLYHGEDTDKVKTYHLLYGGIVAALGLNLSIQIANFILKINTHGKRNLDNIYHYIILSLLISRLVVSWPEGIFSGILLGHYPDEDLDINQWKIPLIVLSATSLIIATALTQIGRGQCAPGFISDMATQDSAEDLLTIYDGAQRLWSILYYGALIKEELHSENSQTQDLLAYLQEWFNTNPAATSTELIDLIYFKTGNACEFVVATSLPTKSNMDVLPITNSAFVSYGLKRYYVNKAHNQFIELKLEEEKREAFDRIIINRSDEKILTHEQLTAIRILTNVRHVTDPQAYIKFFRDIQHMENLDVMENTLEKLQYHVSLLSTDLSEELVQQLFVNVADDFSLEQQRSILAILRETLVAELDKNHKQDYLYRVHEALKNAELELPRAAIFELLGNICELDVTKLPDISNTQLHDNLMALPETLTPTLLATLFENVDLAPTHQEQQAIITALTKRAKMPNNGEPWLKVLSKSLTEYTLSLAPASLFQLLRNLSALDTQQFPEILSVNQLNVTSTTLWIDTDEEVQHPVADEQARETSCFYPLAWEEFSADQITAIAKPISDEAHAGSGPFVSAFVDGLPDDQHKAIIRLAIKVSEPSVWDNFVANLPGITEAFWSRNKFWETLKRWRGVAARQMQLLHSFQNGEWMLILADPKRLSTGIAQATAIAASQVLGLMVTGLEHFGASHKAYSKLNTFLYEANFGIEFVVKLILMVLPTGLVNQFPEVLKRRGFLRDSTIGDGETHYNTPATLAFSVVFLLGIYAYFLTKITYKTEHVMKTPGLSEKVLEEYFHHASTVISDPEKQAAVVNLARYASKKLHFDSRQRALSVSSLNSQEEAEQSQNSASNLHRRSSISFQNSFKPGSAAGSPNKRSFHRQLSVVSTRSNGYIDVRPSSPPRVPPSLVSFDEQDEGAEVARSSSFESQPAATTPIQGSGIAHFLRACWASRRRISPTDGNVDRPTHDSHTLNAYKG